MSVQIKIVPDASLTMQLGDSWSVLLNERILFQCADEQQADWFARKLSAARSESKHNAMNILREQLGFSEPMAESIFFVLKTDAAANHEGSYSVN